MNESAKKRVVAIVGRPNVGKSALFNRMAGRRIAIVHEFSGVTRDRLMREVEWDNQRFELIDTGGVCTIDNAISRDVIEVGIRGQIDVALGDAAVALLVVDLKDGLLPMDEEVARLLRAGGKRVVIAANKADAPEWDSRAEEFEALGFPAFPVSAQHNRGIDVLVTHLLGLLPATENTTLTKPLRVAVVGRPNVGKSSYINRLLRASRVIVSNVPGTTRDSVDIPFSVGEGDQARHYVLVDTAGMRKRAKVNDTLEYFSYTRAEGSIQDSDVVVLVLDAAQGPGVQDKKIAGAVNKYGKGCVVLVNKWDLATVTQRVYAPAIIEHMPFLRHCPIIFVSAENGYNVRRSIDAIDHVGSQVKLTLPTGILNRTLMDAGEKTHPPAVQGQRLKMYYATQVGYEPLRIRIFVNNPKLVTTNYQAYLVRMLRGKFGLEGAPLVLHFAARRASREEAKRSPTRRPGRETDRRKGARRPGHEEEAKSTPGRRPEPEARRNPPRPPRRDAGRGKPGRRKR